MDRPKLLDLNNHDQPAVIDAADAPLAAGKTFYRGKNGYVYYSTWQDGHSTPHVLHGLIFGPVPWPMQIDHKDRDPLNCRRSNLRMATPQQNQVNSIRSGTSKHGRGVTVFNKSKNKPWRAQIMVDHRQIHLGLFTTQEAALEARVAAERKYYGEVCPR